MWGGGGGRGATAPTWGLQNAEHSAQHEGSGSSCQPAAQGTTAVPCAQSWEHHSTEHRWEETAFPSSPIPRGKQQRPAGFDMLRFGLSITKAQIQDVAPQLCRHREDAADPAVAGSTVHFTLGGALLGEVEAKSNISSSSFYNVKVFELLNHLPAFKTNSFKHKELASHFLKMRV